MIERMLRDELREIRNQLRLAMNGAISASMRAKGIHYKLNFGVPLPEIKQIAATHEPGSELAAALWKEDIREFKILASFLQPADDFPPEEAANWVKEIPYPEIAEQCSRNLFCKLPYVGDFLLCNLSNREDTYGRTVAFLVYAELFKEKREVSAPVKEAFLRESMRTVASPGFAASFIERQVAVKAMKFYGRQSEKQAERILADLGSFREFMETPEGRETYDDLSFEFEYCRE